MGLREGTDPAFSIGMLNAKNFLMVAAVTLLGACGRYAEGTAAGEVIDPAVAAKTVVLRVDNTSTSSMELRTVLNGSSQFIGSVGGNESTTIALDPMMFPTATLFVVALPADGHGRAVVGPLAATKGDLITFTIQPALNLSRATVRP